MDQRVTVYIQQGAMNGSISDEGKMIALSKQLQMEYKQYLRHQTFCCYLDDCKLHIKFLTKHYISV